jgi:hypothetical protein
MRRRSPGDIAMLAWKAVFPKIFNAVTGEPLRDLAYTWTASVFVDLLNTYVSPPRR